MLLLSVVIVSIFALVPDQGRVALGLELLGTSLAAVAGVALLTRRTLASPDGRAYLSSQLGLVLPGLALLVVGAVSLLAGAGGGLYWVLAGVVWAFLGAVLNAWVLLVEILR